MTEDTESRAVRIPAMKCPAFGDINDATTSLRPLRPMPQEGDFSICHTCGVIGKFATDLTIYIPDPDEAFAEITNDPELAVKLATAQGLIFEKNRHSHH
jgi:hypothetical protein